MSKVYNYQDEQTQLLEEEEQKEWCSMFASDLFAFGVEIMNIQKTFHELEQERESDIEERRRLL